MLIVLCHKLSVHLRHRLDNFDGLFLMSGRTIEVPPELGVWCRSPHRDVRPRVASWLFADNLHRSQWCEEGTNVLWQESGHLKRLSDHALSRTEG